MHSVDPARAVDGVIPFTFFSERLRPVPGAFFFLRDLRHEKSKEKAWPREREPLLGLAGLERPEPCCATHAAGVAVFGYDDGSVGFTAEDVLFKPRGDVAI